MEKQDIDEGGIAIENAIRMAIHSRVDFYGFADSARCAASELGLSDEERDRIFSRLSNKIHDWIKNDGWPKS